MVSVSRNMPNFEESGGGGGGEGGGGQPQGLPPPPPPQPPPQSPHPSQQHHHHTSQPASHSSMMLGTGGTTARSSSSSSSNRLTPYDSLKELVKKKRQRAVLGGGGGAAGGVMMAAGGVSMGGGGGGGGGEGGLPQGLPPPPVIATHDAHVHHHHHQGTNNNIIVGGQHQHQKQHLGIGGGEGSIGPPPVKTRKVDFGLLPRATAAASSSATVSSTSVSNHHHHHDDNSIRLQQQHSAHAQHASSSSSLKHSVSAPVFKPSNFLRQALYPKSSSKQQLSSMARHTSLSSFDAFANHNYNNSNMNTTFSGDSRLQRVLERNNSNNNAFLNNGFNLKSLPDRLKAQQQQQRLPESALHRACCRGDGVAIRRHLQQHPFDAGNASQLKTLQKRYNGMFRIVETRRLPERYTFPINLAIQHGASSDALRELARLAPQALTTPDGPNREISIHILLSRLPSRLTSQDHYLAMVDLILLKYPMVAKAKDRLLNLPLHVACRHGCPLDVVRHVCIMYPDALFMRNFHGLTPVDLANRHCHNTRNSDGEAVVNYLWEAVAEQTESLLLDQPMEVVDA